MRWIIALFVLTTIDNATTAWICIDQALSSFNAVKTNNYIPLFKSLSNIISASEHAAQWGLRAFSSVMISFIFDYLMTVSELYIQSIKAHHSHPPLSLLTSNRLCDHCRDGCGILWPYSFLREVCSTAFRLMSFRPIDSNPQLVVSGGCPVKQDRYQELISSASTRCSSRQCVSRSLHLFILPSLIKVKYPSLESGLICSASLIVAAVTSMLTDPSALGLFPFDVTVISVQMTHPGHRRSLQLL
ncbi:hypothetical protein PM082_004497 [Marasmius tenuissimus]|nr:hypothetical protein PM082_004497 [Marasmius tenuissimus]